MLLIDAANVVGSRPTGWWRDRAGAARTFTEQVRAAARASRIRGPVVIVLEGAARGGVEEGTVDGVQVIHASGEGDETIHALALSASEPVVVVTADRSLRDRLGPLGAECKGPRWLLDQLQPGAGAADE